MNHRGAQIGVVALALASLASATTAKEPVRQTGAAMITPPEGRPFRGLELDAAETAFRHLFDHNESGQGKEARFYCLAQRSGERAWSDVPTEFLRRFSNVAVPVLNYSECSVRSKTGVVAKSVPGTGLILYLAVGVCRNETSCDVVGGYYEASLSASGHTLTLEKTDGRWVVVSDKSNWIS